MMFLQTVTMIMYCVFFVWKTYIIDVDDVLRTAYYDFYRSECPALNCCRFEESQDSSLRLSSKLLRFFFFFK
jgi:hypothetical protein